MQKLLKLRSLSKNFVKKNKEIVDIVLFGSSVRSKTLPEDIDICVIGIRIDNNLIEKFENAIKKIHKKIHISSLSLKDFLRGSLWKTIFHEGYSLIRNKEISELLGFKSFVIFWYNLKNLKQKEKVKFYYALRGRKMEEGLLKKLNGIYLGKGVIAVPLKYEDDIRDLFMKWKIPCNRRRILLEE